MTDYTKLLGDFPEINPANYGDDEVNALNAWGIAAHTAIEALQAENERLKLELKISKLDTKEWYSQADALQSKLDAMSKEEPRFWYDEDMGELYSFSDNRPVDGLTPLYAAPKALAPLTDEQIYNVFASTVEDAKPFSELVGDPIWAEVVEITRAIEAAHGIGGTP